MKKNGEMHKALCSTMILFLFMVGLSLSSVKCAYAYRLKENDSLFFSYKQLQRKILPFKKVNLPKFITTSTREIRPGSDRPNTLRVSEENTSVLKIRLYQYSLNWFDEKGLIERERIGLNRKIYSLDSLFNNSLNERPLRLEMTAMYEVKHKNKKHSSIQFEGTDFNGTSLQPWYILLCDVTDLSSIKLYALTTLNNDDTSYQEPICIGDFNFDGNLEFAKWDNNQGNEIRSYSLKDGKCILQPYFLKLFELDKGNFYIDIPKSKWYFSLK